MYFLRWRGILFLVCAIFVACSMASCEYTTKEKEAIDKIADELMTEGPAGANLTPSATFTPTHTPTPTPTPTVTPTPTPVKVSYHDDPEDVKCPYTHNLMDGMLYLDLRGFELGLQGLQVVGVLEFGDPDLGTSLQTQPYWMAGVVGAHPEAETWYDFGLWGYGEWSMDCWYYEQNLECGFAMRQNGTYDDIDYQVDVSVEGSRMTFVFPYGYPRVGDMIGAYAQTDSAYDFLGMDDTGLLLSMDLLCPFPNEVVGMVLDSSYTLCGPGCWLRDKIVEGQNAEVWCMNDSPCVAKGCECHLFSRALGDPPQDPDSWGHVAEPGEKIRKDNTQAYHCFCVQ